MKGKRCDRNRFVGLKLVEIPGMVVEVGQCGAKNVGNPVLLGGV